jgi:hypothetical protein
MNKPQTLASEMRTYRVPPEHSPFDRLRANGLSTVRGALERVKAAHHAREEMELALDSNETCLAWQGLSHENSCLAVEVLLQP